MANDIFLKTFPKNECEALAMLYIQNQDLSGLTPEQLLEKYQETYDKISEHRKLCRDRKSGLIK